ncbi:MAG: hypothetical protein C5B48_16610 [Candidatus Rokuibacteriota bacterium]|nr:MAG: hypothetical protein C5B48_16610 [Candidatus Rokubacteria bacterium]
MFQVHRCFKGARALMSSVSRQPGAGRGGVKTAISRSALRMQSDRRLVALARAGSSAAFSVIVERYREPLHGYTRRLVGPNDADDVLQQTFVNALGALRRDDRPIEVRPWLYRIAHNVSVNALRRSGRNYEQLDEQYDGVPQPPDVVDRKHTINRLVDEINDLPERQRTAIVAHELEGRSYAEIAQSMSATTPIVRQLVHRARTRLRDACGVVVPTWALRWLAVADLRTAGSERVGEAVAGGATGAGLLKAGTALLATGAIATGAGGIVIKHDRDAGGHRAAASAVPEHVGSAPAPKPAVTRPAFATQQSDRQRGAEAVQHEQESKIREIARAPVRSHLESNEDGPTHPERQGRRERGDAPDRSHGPTPGNSIGTSHDGSGDHHVDGSIGGGGGDFSPGDGSGDPSGDSGSGSSHDGHGSGDAPAGVPIEP